MQATETRLTSLDFDVIKAAFRRAVPALKDIDPIRNCDYGLDLFRMIKRVRDCEEAGTGMTWWQFVLQLEACPLVSTKMDTFLRSLHNTSEFDMSPQYQDSVFHFQQIMSDYLASLPRDLSKATESELDDVFGKTSKFRG